MRKTLLCSPLGRWLAVAALGLLAAPVAQAQLTGTKTISNTGTPSAPDYATLAAAIADLNTQGVGTGGVTFNIAAGHLETFATPTAGAITATGTAANPIIFQKSGAGANPLITSGTGTSTVDAIISLSGSDYVTIDGIDVADATTNTSTTPRAEYGYALFRGSPTDGCQYNTIRNCVVTLNKTNSNTVGIYSPGFAAGSNTAVTATAPSGANSYNRVYGNVVTNALNGIYFAASATTAVANYDQNNEVGSVIAPATTPTGNIVGNFGGSSTAGGIYATYQNGLKIQGNTVNSTLNYTSATASTPVAASTVTSSFYGIYAPSGGGATLDITGNTVTLASGSTSASTLSGVHVAMTLTGALTVTGNTLSMSYLTATTGSVYGFYNTSSPNTVTISGNTISGIATSTTGTTSLIQNLSAAPVINVLNNQLSGLSRTGASGSVYGYYNNTGGSGTQTVSNNTLSNLSVTGTSILYALYTNTNANETEIFTNNQVSNLTGGTGTMYGVGVGYATAASQVSGNTLTDISAQGTLYGVYLGSNVLGANVYQNTIGNLTTSATTNNVAGIYATAGTSGTAVNIYRNKVYNIGGTALTTGAVYGIYVSSNPNISVYNNLVGNLTAPTATGLLAVAGLYISSGANVNVYYNTIYLNASSSGATFGTSGIYLASTSSVVDLRNNLVVNKSTSAGTGGYTAALRRTSGTTGTAPANLASTSNNNLYYAGTPSATNLIYLEGTTTATNPQQTLASYQALVATRESASVTEDVPFLSLSGPAATFLHISPTTATQAESGGTPVSGITTDFDGEVRNATTPDIGADEFLNNLDIAVVALVSPTPTGSCFGSTEAVTVSIRNAATAALNFAANPVTVTVTITPPGAGSTPVTFTTTVNTGTLAANATQNVTLTGTADLSAAGAYAVTVSAALTGDDNPANNTLTPALTITSAPRSASFTYAGATGTICAGSTTTLAPTLGTGATAGTFSSTTGLTINATTGVINPATSTAGTYVITNTLPATSGCPVSTATQSVTIAPATTATFSYAGSPFCVSGTTTPTATVTGTSGGTFSSTTGLTINATTGAITLVSSTPGTYTVTYSVAGPCPSSSTQSVTINAAPVATFSYGTTSTFCLSGTTNPTVTLGAGATAGTFSSTAGLTLNATTGVITLSSSTPGTYTVTNTIAAAGGCAAATATATVTITTAPVATFSYPAATTYCAGSTSTVTPTLGTGASAGTFSSTTGLSINATTGVISLATSVAGTYTVTNAIAASGSCAAASATTTVTIAPATSAAFSYSGTSFCASGTTAPVATVTGTSGGTFSSTTGLTINAATGAITLASSTPGTYTVTYTVAGACGSSSTQSVTITAAPLATFSYGTTSTFCVSGTTTPAVVLGTGATAGTFSASPVGLTLNATTGAITLSSSTPGTYTVTNTIAAAGGCAAATATATVTIAAAPVAAFTYPTATICAGQTATVTPTLGTGATAGTFSSTAGLSINATTGVISPATSTAGTYTVTNTVAASGGCAAASATTSVTVSPLPATPTVTVTYPTVSTALLTSSVAPAGATYQWYLGTNAIAGATGQTYTANGTTTPGAYTVRLIFTATGCQSAASTTTTVTATARPLAGTSLRLFPNPTTNGLVTLQLSGYTKPVQLTALDALGRVVLTQKVAAGQSQVQLDLSGTATGVYLLRATTEGGTDVLRIVRQ